MIVYDENKKRIELKGNKKDIIKQCIDIMILVRNVEPGFRNEKNYSIIKEVVEGLDNTFFEKKEYEVVFTESLEEQLAYTE